MRISAVVVEAFGPPEVLRLSATELPPPLPRQVRVKVEAAGVNPSDTYLRQGPLGPYGAVPQLLPQLPYTPGKDGAGVVEALGDEVSNLQVGQRVYVSAAGSGTYASHANLDVAGVYPLPDAASFAEGACVGVPCATALYALKYRGQAHAGCKVFVHGASGAVGLAAVQLAKDMGCFVAGSAGTPLGLEAVKRSGADLVVCHREEGYVEQALAACDGYDVVLEMAAHANLATDLRLVALNGRICIVGSKAQDVALNPRLLMPKQVDLRGVFLGSALPQELSEIHAELHGAMARRSLVPVVSQRLPLRDAARAHVEVMEPSAGGASGNVVLLPDGSNL